MYSPTKDNQYKVKLGKNPKIHIIYGSRIIKKDNYKEHSK